VLSPSGAATTVERCSGPDGRPDKASGPERSWNHEKPSIAAPARARRAPGERGQLDGTSRHAASTSLTSSP
jgi:hypothetical protein